MLSDYWFWGIAGFFIGGFLAVANLVRNKCGFTSSIVAVTIGVYFGALGTRLLYILIFHPHLFVENPLLAMAFWQETGTWLGGPLLGGLALALSFYILKEPVLTSLGSVAPGLALAHAIARIGCVVNGCCFGAPSTAWCAIYNKHLQTTVHPTPIYSMIGELINLVILQTLWRKPANRKYLFPLYLLILSFHRFFSDMFRGSETGPELIPGLRIFQVICLFIFVFAACWLMIVKWKKKGFFAGLSLVGISFLVAFTVRVTFDEEKSVQTPKPVQGSYLVATRHKFVDDLSGWINHRKNAGYEMIIQGWKYSPNVQEIKDWINLKKNNRAKTLFDLSS